jgi:hypothetical protein
MRRYIFILPAVLVFTAVGCGGQFAHITLVERLRILGIRAEPPETDIFGEVELSALIADPRGAGRPLDCTWAVCLFELGGAATDISCPGPGSFYLSGDCDSATVRMNDLVAWLAEQGFQVGRFDPDNPPMRELPLIVGLQVQAATVPNGTAPESGAETARGFKRIGVRLAATPEEPNRNPRLRGVSVGGMRWEAGADPLEIVANQKVLVVPEADVGTRQTYMREDDDIERLEDFLFSWFCTSGVFLHRRTILDVDSHGERLDTNTWSLPASVLSPEHTLWLVVRDGRYGTDWLEVPVEILPQS